MRKTEVSKTRVGEEIFLPFLCKFWNRQKNLRSEGYITKNRKEEDAIAVLQLK